MSRKGFALIRYEFLIVIAILGVIAAVAIPSLMRIKEVSHISKTDNLTTYCLLTDDKTEIRVRGTNTDHDATWGSDAVCVSVQIGTRKVATVCGASVFATPCSNR